MGLDARDREILRLLQADAALTQAEIGRRVGLSAAAVNERLKKLERDGVLRGWTVLLDDQKVGAGITAFVEVFIEGPEHEREFVELVSGMEEVQECHFVTGDFSCLVKAKVAGRGELRELILDRINGLAGVRQTRTFIVLETAKETPRLRIPEPETEGRGE
jgi:Lrp/AsnC family leucine-responsive transcriptional regulator